MRKGYNEQARASMPPEHSKELLPKCPPEGSIPFKESSPDPGQERGQG